jgi:hypothetical protein
MRLEGTNFLFVLRQLPVKLREATHLLSLCQLP